MFWQLLFFQACFFLLLLFVLQRFFHGNLVKAIARIEELRKRNVKKEEELKAAQTRFQSECQEKIRSVTEEVAQIRRRSEEEILLLRKQAAKEIEQNKLEWKKGMESRQVGLEQRFEKITQMRAGVLACDLVAKSFTDKMRQTLHHILCEELIAELSKESPKKLSPDERLRVTFAEALEADQWTRLSVCLKKLLPDEVNRSAEQAQDKSLVAGFTLEIGDLLLDGSLKNRMDRALQKLGDAP